MANYVCLYCGMPAVSVAWYGDDDACFGGGPAPVFLCGSCPSPCNHPGDPHAGYVSEERLDAADPSPALAWRLDYQPFDCDDGPPTKESDACLTIRPPKRPPVGSTV